MASRCCLRRWTQGPLCNRAHASDKVLHQHQRNGTNMTLLALLKIVVRSLNRWQCAQVVTIKGGRIAEAWRHRKSHCEGTCMQRKGQSWSCWVRAEPTSYLSDCKVFARAVSSGSTLPGFGTPFFFDQALTGKRSPYSVRLRRVGATAVFLALWPATCCHGGQLRYRGLHGCQLRWPELAFSSSSTFCGPLQIVDVPLRATPMHDRINQHASARSMFFANTGSSAAGMPCDGMS